MRFEWIASIVDREVIAAGAGVRIRERLRKAYGGALAKDEGRCDNSIAERGNSHRRVTLEEHGVGKRYLKMKRFLNET